MNNTNNTNNIDHVDCIVIGAGVVGLAVARALALKGQGVLVLEAASAIGTGTSSRSSEVIHSGIYYPTGSLKAQLCVRGNPQLYAYCAARGIGHRRCGKLIVATQASQLAQLQVLAATAEANGVHDLVLLSRSQARVLEPQLDCAAALLCPSTGIIDSHALMLALQADLEAAGGLVVLNTAVAGVLNAFGAMTVVANDAHGSPFELRAQQVINAAGLQAPAVAKCIKGLAASHVPPTFWAKGNYFALRGKSPFSRLVYPIPEAAGLGVHATLDLGGQTRFGPDVEWVSRPDDLQVNPARAEAFYAEVRKYWPALPDGALQPDYAGMRPKLQGEGAGSSDFVIQGQAVHGVPGLVNLFGMESPGLTSCLAIGELVRECASG